MLTFSLFLMSYVLNDSKIIEDLYTFVGSLFAENCFVEKKSQFIALLISLAVYPIYIV